jgi:ubiquinone/menaquinone biosynthesis C-methylase UbiE
MSSQKKSKEEAQPKTAARLYDVRAEDYDNSHHPNFAKWIVTDMLKPQPAEHILDLACGTGLVSFPAAEAVGPEGIVVGIDVSDGMLMEAEKKILLRKERGHGLNVQFINHDIADLASCAELKGREGTFDAIVCASALVLLRDPWHATRDWIRTWLKPGGRFITDVLDCTSQKPGVALESTCMRLGIQPPQYRLWVKSKDDFQRFLEDLHLDVEKIVFKESTGSGTKYYEIGDVDEVWDTNLSKEPARSIRESGMAGEARGIFNDEWAKMADENGKIADVDSVDVCVARKPNPWIFDDAKPVISGSCACGNVKVSSTSSIIKKAQPAELSSSGAVPSRQQISTSATASPAARSPAAPSSASSISHTSLSLSSRSEWEATPKRSFPKARYAASAAIAGAL